MKLIDLYKPFIGTESKFLDKYSQETQDIAQNFWNGLSSSCIFFVVSLLFLSVFVCVYYFTAYNNIPGRHYKRSHWVGAYVVSVLLTFFVTVALGYMLNNTALNGSGYLIWYIAFGNLIYSVIIFGILSCIWFLWLPTNAYRLIGKN